MADSDSADLAELLEGIDSKVSALLVLALETHLRAVGLKTKDRTVDRMLSDAGLSTSTIARLLGKTPRAVQAALQKHRARKTRAKRGRRAKQT
jgi:hypothetical protein